MLARLESKRGLERIGIESKKKLAFLAFYAMPMEYSISTTEKDLAKKSYAHLLEMAHLFRGD